MARRTSTGTCGLCGKSFSKSGISRHLESCQGKAAAAQERTPARRGRMKKGFRLAVEGRDLPEYWLRLDVPADTPLWELDAFLRYTWLECCGHMSAFNIGGFTYFLEDREQFADIDDRDMTVALGRVLRPRMKFLHEYDFGTTTELVLRVVSERETKDPDIRILARNDPPALACAGCGAVATQICSECVWEGEEQGLFCDECVGGHAAGHSWGEELLLPVVNSPRVGMCAYTGPEADG